MLAVIFRAKRKCPFVLVDRRTSQSTSVVMSFCAASLLVARSPQVVSIRACTWAVVKSSWSASRRPTTSAVSRKNGYASAVMPQCSQMRSWPEMRGSSATARSRSARRSRGIPLQIRRMMPEVLALDSVPGSSSCKCLIQERAQFGLVGRLDEPIQHGVQPRPLDLLRDTDDLPHAPSLVIATNGTMTSSRAIPPWDTIFVAVIRERLEIARQENVPCRWQAVVRPAHRRRELGRDLLTKLRAVVYA